MLQKRLPEKLSVSRFDVADESTDEIKARIATAKETLSLFSDEFYPRAVRGLTDPNDGLSSMILELEGLLPVCLSGCANFYVNVRERVERVDVLLTTIPGNGKTFISVSALPVHWPHLQAYAHHRLRDSFAILGAVETWMIHGTDHWYLSPDVWRDIRPEHQVAIIEDIKDTSKSLSDSYGRGIFNATRRSLLAQVLTTDQYTKSEKCYLLSTQERLLTDR